jgi:Tol biopolymer transport system component
VLVSPPFPAKESQITAVKNLEIAGTLMQLTFWAPDGRTLSGGILNKPTAAAIGVGVYDLAAGKATKLTDDRGVFYAPFLPDGKRLIYVTISDELVVVDIATGKRRVIPVALGSQANAESFAVAPDGKTLYFGAARVEANVWKVVQR